MKKVLLIGIFLTVLGFSVFANAELQNNGNDLIYDTDLDITWYNPNISAMSWNQAMTWAEGLTAGGATGWRLPSALNENGSYPYYGYAVVGSELGHLYYEALNNAVYGPLARTESFVNLQPVNYWSSTVTAQYAGNAFAFSFNNGKQGHADKNLTANFSAIAVHSGNVGTLVPMAEAAADITSRSKRNPLSSRRIAEYSQMPFSPEKVSLHQVR
jgi:hypothetical protein